MTMLRRNLLLNLYSTPSDLLKVAKDTELHVKKVIKSIQAMNGSLDELIERLDDISDKMCVVTDSAECIRRLHPESRWRKAADEAFNSTCSLMNQLNSDRSLARTFGDNVNKQFIDTSTELGAVIESFKRDFEIFKDLSDRERIQIIKLQESVENASHEFENLQSIGSLEKMIKLKFELAKALGFETPLEICLRDKQLNRSELVMNFLSKKWDELGKGDQSRSRFACTNLKRIVEVLTRLSSELFDIRIEVNEYYDFGGDLSFKFQVYDGGNEYLGTVLFDLSARRLKDPHPTHYTIKCRKASEVGLFLISIGIEDFERITWAQSQSISHEFGHALHSLLSKTKFQVLSGTRGPVDLAEIPSSLFEIFHDNLQKDLMGSLGKLIKISDEKIRREEAFQIQIATIDQFLHSIEPPTTGQNWSRDLAHQVESLYSVKRGNDWHCSLPHLSTYGGTYFSYIFSKSVARTIWERNQMKEFRREFLEKGGTARLDFIK